MCLQVLQVEIQINLKKSNNPTYYNLGKILGPIAAQGYHSLVPFWRTTRGLCLSSFLLPFPLFLILKTRFLTYFPDEDRQVPV